jgi:hypothetical protein
MKSCKKIMVRPTTRAYDIILMDSVKCLSLDLKPRSIFAKMNSKIPIIALTADVTVDFENVKVGNE